MLKLNETGRPLSRCPHSIRRQEIRHSCAFEYKAMYKALSKRYHAPDTLSVTPIAAGALKFHTQCACYERHGVHKNNCQGRLKRNPIPRQKQLCHNILTFERNHA